VQEVHHIKPLAEGGTHNETTLMSLCKSCHSAITITETNRKTHGNT
jgi:5-methylcytosine-specific restriction protein A